MYDQRLENSISVALISFFPKMTGTTVTIEYYYRALENMGFRVKWYQLASDDEMKSYTRPQEFIRGIRGVPQSIRLPLNILFIMPRRIKEIKEDILLITDQAGANLSVYHKNSITIVHDIRELTRYNTSILRRMFFKYVLRFLQKSSRIIAVSDYTKDLLSEKLKINDNVAVVPNCYPQNDYSDMAEKRAKHGLSRNSSVNVLYVAADRPYKNIRLFLHIAESILQRNLPVKYNFILVSKITRGTRRILKRLKLPNLQVFHDLPELNAIYEKSDVLLFTSFIEGFGLPIIEAMSQGIPVIHANLRPMKEIVMGGGLSVNPAHIDDWVEALISIMEPHTYRQKSSAAFERAKTFEFSKFEEKLKQVMEEYLKKTGIK